MLAEGGICLVGNISPFKKDVKDKLQQSMSLLSLHSTVSSPSSSTVLETGQVTLTLPKRLGLEETQQLSWPLCCTLWACLDQQQRSRAFNKADVDVVRTHTMHVRGTRTARVVCVTLATSSSSSLPLYTGDFTNHKSICRVSE